MVVVEPEDVPELQAAAVEQTAAGTATSVHSLGVDPGSDLSFDLCTCVSLCNRRGYRARVTYVHLESCPTLHIESCPTVRQGVGKRQVSAEPDRAGS